MLGEQGTAVSWTCSVCGCLVFSGSIHRCYGLPDSRPVPNLADQTDRLIDAVERLVRATERLVDLLGTNSTQNVGPTDRVR